MSTHSFSISRLVMFQLLLATLAWGVEPLKVICATHAAQAPVIDGKLDDPCWQQTEVRSDFAASGDGRAVAQLTTVRFVYDDAALYMALEFYWDDVEALKHGIADIVATKGEPKPGSCDHTQYANRFGAELFIDPDATASNYYQILFNAAGQYTGNYKAQWEAFHGGHTIKSAVHGNCWTVEFVFPWNGLKAGDEWGLNLCRNDASYYAMWKQVGGSFHSPHLFGRIVMGSYSDWLQAVSQRGSSRLQETQSITAVLNAPSLEALHAAASRSAKTLGNLAAQHPPVSRENFELLYPAYHAFDRDLSRYTSTIETLTQIARTKPAP